jgi:hypothetical protein
LDAETVQCQNHWISLQEQIKRYKKWRDNCYFLGFLRLLI